MNRTILGIDIAKKTFHVALLREQKVRNKAFDNTAKGHADLALWLEKHAPGKVYACLEATSTYGEALATFLHEVGHTVSLVNPVRIHAYGKSALVRTKTDRADAALIARFCLTENPAPWQPLPAPIRTLQALVRRIDTLQDLRQQEINRLDPQSAPQVIASITEVIKHLDQEIAKLLRQVDEHIDRHPELKQQHDLLKTIKGFGDLTAARFLAEVGPIERYRDARQVAAYIGLSPAEHQSGEMRGHTRLSKMGNPRLRRALYMPAIVAKRHNRPIKLFCERLLARGKAPKAVIGAAMRKLVHIAYAVLKSGNPFDPNFACAA